MKIEQAIEAAPTHPEEFRATYDYRFGDSVTLQGTARMTPAGLVTLALAVSSIILSVAVLTKARRSPGDRAPSGRTRSWLRRSTPNGPA